MSKQFILASASPRRRALLEQIGVSCDVRPVDVEECREEGEKPEEYVQRLAVTKARTALDQLPNGNPWVVLGSDTIVSRGDAVYEKPLDESDFKRIMSQLSEQDHKVITAVCVTDGDRQEVKLASTTVSFRAISEQEMVDYWLTGEPRDKAGGYGIQGLGAVFVTGIQGSYSNVVGLPLFETAELLKNFKVPVWQPRVN